VLLHSSRGEPVDFVGSFDERCGELTPGFTPSIDQSHEEKVSRLPLTWKHGIYLTDLPAPYPLMMTAPVSRGCHKYNRPPRITQD
jgi:hypothetical protein